MTVTPEVPPPNHAPVVSAGPDRTLRQPETTLALEGTVADDGRPGGALSHAWTVVSGPGPVTFGDAASTSTSATFETPGTYVLRLSANDGELGTLDDTTVFYASATALPDLVVTSVDASTIVVDPLSLSLSGSAGVEIANAGAGTAAGPFAPDAVRGPQCERGVRRGDRPRPGRRSGHGSRRLRGCGGRRPRRGPGELRRQPRLRLRGQGARGRGARRDQQLRQLVARVRGAPLAGRLERGPRSGRGRSRASTRPRTA